MEEDQHADQERRLEAEQLDEECERLAQEDPRGVESEEPRAVARGLAALDRHRALGGQDGGEEHGEPEEPGSALGEQPGLGPEREGEEQEAQQCEGQHLPEGDSRAQLDAKVSGGDEPGITPHRRPPGAVDRRSAAPAPAHRP